METVSGSIKWEKRAKMVDKDLCFSDRTLYILHAALIIDIKEKLKALSRKKNS